VAPAAEAPRHRLHLQGSELVLEVAEARLVNVSVEGSLLVYAQHVMGHMEQGQASSGSSSSGTSMAAWQPSSSLQQLGNNITTWSRGDRSQQYQQHQQLPSPSSGNPFAADSGAAPYGAAGQRLVYSSRCGRINLQDVTVHNVGIDWRHQGNVYWRHRVARHEACRILLHGRCVHALARACAGRRPACAAWRGAQHWCSPPRAAQRPPSTLLLLPRCQPNALPSPAEPPTRQPTTCLLCCSCRSEFEARGVVISGNHVFEVPDGYRMVLSPEPAGRPGFRQQLLPLPSEQPSWQWQYSQGERGEVLLAYQQHEHSCPASGGPGSGACADEAAEGDAGPVLHYTI
jgi:hypothetical protein